MELEEVVAVPPDDPNGMETPCFGDPIRHPTVAPTQNGSVFGGTYGCTRTTTKNNCSFGTYNTFHNGIDIMASLNTELHSMHGGIVHDHGYSETLGYYVRIESNIGGNQVLIQYAHLNQILVSDGSQVEAGTPIALSGNTGNADDEVGTIAHVHIRVHVNWMESDPISFFGTSFNSDGTINQECVDI